jgi:succinate dehydrogenase / fumarate reductase, cytochrome b subunit
VSAIQIAFVAGLLVVLITVTAYSALVIGGAIRGDSTLGVAVFSRPRDHGQLGRAAFLAHRISGFGIFAFLALHILDIALYSVSHHLYDGVQGLYGSAPLRLFECGLLFAVLFHTANGLRLVALDLTASPAWSGRALRIVIATTAALGAAGSGVILAPLFR